MTLKIKPFIGYDMRHKTDHAHTTCGDLLINLKKQVVPALDPVPAKCTISSLIKDLLTLIGIENA
jgi:hypothetical protein